MAVLREGRLHRRASDGEVAAMQRAQAMAARRKLERRLHDVKPEQTEYRGFLVGCLHDVGAPA